MKQALFLIGILFSTVVFTQNQKSIFANDENNLLKSSRLVKSTTHKLDSIIVSEHYNSEDIWETRTIQKYTYHTDGSIATNEQFDFNLDEGTSANTSKNEYTYDSNGNLTMDLEYYWDDETEEWKQGTKEEYTYDINDNLLSKISRSFVNSTSTWKNTDKREYQYNSSNQEITNTYFQWPYEGNEWETSSKMETEYNLSGLVSVMISYQWDTEATNWNSSTKYSYIYEDNTLTSYSGQNWSTSLNEWTNNYNTTLTYNENQNITLRFMEKWDTDNYQWGNYRKYEYDYDSNGDFVYQSSSSWDISTSIWEESSKSNYNYDETIPANEAILNIPVINEFFDFHYYKEVNAPLSYLYFSYYGDAWHESKKGECFYSELSSSISNNSELINNVVLYPNPSNGIINISVPNIENTYDITIYNISGEMIKTKRFSGNVKINLSEFSNGQYYLKYNEGSKTSIKSFIISK